MENTYEVKTRNWYSKKWVKSLLDISERFGVQRGDSYQDGDGKYILRTKSAFTAWATWTYFQMLKPLSGGWTYIVRPGKHFTREII